jgi:rare lipoprotein A
MLALALLACSVPGYDCGKASWYGHERKGKIMANHKRFDPGARTAASYAYPLGTVLEVTSADRRVFVNVTDRGPARRLGRLLDLSERAARELHYNGRGVIDVQVMVVKFTPEVVQ